MTKGKKWYGWTAEEAEEQWDSALRDKNGRKRKDAFGEMTVAKLSTVVASSGTRVANKKEMGSFNEFNAGDQDAIDDAREGSILNMVEFG